MGLDGLSRIKAVIFQPAFIQCFFLEIILLTGKNELPDRQLI